jgi:AcrR family transcriptional regulator
MNRPVNQLKRSELLARIADYALEQGVTTLTLRPTAAAVGTSARMLIHHFGSRDALVGDVLLAIEQRLAASIMQSAPKTDAAGVLRRMWTETAAPALRPLVRAVFEAWGCALMRPETYGDYLQRIFAPWRDALATTLEAAGEPAERTRARATLALAAFNGLQLVRLTTADDALADAAFELMIRQVLSGSE